VIALLLIRIWEHRRGKRTGDLQHLLVLEEAHRPLNNASTQSCAPEEAKPERGSGLTGSRQGFRNGDLDERSSPVLDLASTYALSDIGLACLRVRPSVRDAFSAIAVLWCRRKSNRGDWTPLELFYTHLSKWPDSIRRMLAANNTGVIRFL
jgi:hypothetical protein